MLATQSTSVDGKEIFAKNLGYMIKDFCDSCGHLKLEQTEGKAGTEFPNPGNAPQLAGEQGLLRTAVLHRLTTPFLFWFMDNPNLWAKLSWKLNKVTLFPASWDRSDHCSSEGTAIMAWSPLLEITPETSSPMAQTFPLLRTGGFRAP